MLVPPVYYRINGGNPVTRGLRAVFVPGSGGPRLENILEPAGFAKLATGTPIQRNGSVFNLNSPGTGYWDVENSPQLDIPDHCTALAVARPLGTSFNHMLLHREDFYGSPQGLYLNGSNNWLWGYMGSGVGGVSSGQAINGKIQSVLGATYLSASENVHRAYMCIDGRVINSTSGVYGGYTVGSGWQIGGTNNSNWFYSGFYGDIYMIALWDRQLAMEEGATVSNDPWSILEPKPSPRRFFLYSYGGLPAVPPTIITSPRILARSTIHCEQEVSSGNLEARTRLSGPEIYQTPAATHLQVKGRFRPIPAPGATLIPHKSAANTSHSVEVYCPPPVPPLATTRHVRHRIRFQKDIYLFQAGVKPYGFGQIEEYDFRAGIRPCVSWQFQAGVSDGSITPPQNAVGRCIAPGRFLIAWEAPDEGVPDYYEVWASLALNGSYEWVQGRRVRETYVQLANFPVGIMVYFRVRAHSTGEQYSDFTQVRKATRTPTPMTVQVRSIRNSKIREGAVFMANLPSGTPLAIQFPEEVTVQ